MGRADFSYIHMDLNVLVSTSHLNRCPNVLNFLQIHSTGFFLPWHRLFVETLEEEMRSKCGYDGVHPYWDWTQGNASQPEVLALGFDRKLDAADFYHATIFSDSDYDGLGSWGDPDNDYRIYTGALKDLVVAYPVPHHLRRQFTLQPFLNSGSTPTNPNGPPAHDPLLMVNTTFTAEVVNYTVSSFTGDYIGFQVHTESFNGPHPGPHEIVGGDLWGGCPFGLVPPECVGGPKWAPNGELILELIVSVYLLTPVIPRIDPMFFLHHAVCPIPNFAKEGADLSNVVYIQAIDKIWYDWQRRDPRNQDAFAGGSVSWQVGGSYPLYPTGAPPLLNVRGFDSYTNVWLW